VPAVALVLDLPAEVVLRRNTNRVGRSVDPTVVEHQLSLLRVALDDGRLRSEGFDAVVELRTTDQVDAVRVVRRARRPS
jgi:predicted kinase